MGLYLFKYSIEDEYIRKRIKSEKRNPDGFEIIRSTVGTCTLETEISQSIHNFIKIMDVKYHCKCDSIQRGENFQSLEEQYRIFYTYCIMYIPCSNGIIKHQFKVKVTMYKLSEKFI